MEMRIFSFRDKRNKYQNNQHLYIMKCN